MRSDICSRFYQSLFTTRTMGAMPRERRRVRKSRFSVKRSKPSKRARVGKDTAHGAENPPFPHETIQTWQAGRSGEGAAKKHGTMCCGTLLPLRAIVRKAEAFHQKPPETHSRRITVHFGGIASPFSGLKSVFEYENEARFYLMVTLGTFWPRMIPSVLSL